MLYRKTGIYCQDHPCKNCGKGIKNPHINCRKCYLSKVKKFNNEKEKLICQEYFSKEKPSTYILGKKWKCSYDTIRNIIIRNGYNLRIKSETLRGKKRSEEIKEKMSKSQKIFSIEQELQICNEYFSEEKPTMIILGEKWKCSPECIRDIIIRNGYKTRTIKEVLNTESTKKKMSEAKKKNPVKYWEGKKRPPFSIEWKRKMSKARIKYWNEKKIK